MPFYEETLVPIVFCEGNEPIIDWLKERGLISRGVSCTYCRQPMDWVRRPTTKDGYGWRCRFVDCQKKLGGYGVVCQIDETMFCHKVKHNRGRPPAEQIWVFGIADTSTKPAIGYMQRVQQRNAATLLPIIQNVCRPETVIHSDRWPAYQQVQAVTGLQHDSVNHKLNFVDPDTRVHTQNIESYWNKHKRRMKTMMGIRREFLDSYLAEFMWRDRFQQNAFIHMCQHISLQFPV